LASDLYEWLYLAVPREGVRDEHRGNLGHSFRRVPKRPSAAADIESSKAPTHITLNTIFFARIVGAA
jgi:hypothetical protein